MLFNISSTICLKRLYFPLLSYLGIFVENQLIMNVGIDLSSAPVDSDTEPLFIQELSVLFLFWLRELPVAPLLLVWALLVDGDCADFSCCSWSKGLFFDLLCGLVVSEGDSVCWSAFGFFAELGELVLL